MNRDDVNACVERAREAQVEWAKTPFSERRRVLHVLAKTITKYQDAICRTSSRDTGKTKVEALLGEILTTLEKIRWVCSEGEEVLQPQGRSVGLLTAMKSARVEYVPMGVLGVIAPWNYPFHNLYNHVVSGLFAGNAVVSKASEYSSWSGGLFMRILQNVLAACGHSPELVQLVTGFGDAGAALVESGVDKIIFTGSPAVGKLVMRGASASLTPVILELGGKDPAVLCSDVDLDSVVPTILRGAFQNCGQNCIGIERVYCHSSKYDEFCDRVASTVQQFTQGAPLVAGSRELDLGAMTMPSQISIVDELVQDAVRQGARLLVGGKSAPELGGLFYKPTVLADVTHEMRIAKEEVFGPVMTIIRFEDEDELVSAINSIDYGLGSNVFSGSARRAEALALRLRAGMAAVNDFAVQYMAQSLPFGGVGVSGFGRFAGKEGLRALCYEKSVIVDKVPFIRNVLPPPARYPVSASSVAFIEGLLRLAYADSLSGRFSGLVGLLKSLASSGSS